MLFSVKFLCELKNVISEHTNSVWYKAILDNLDNNEISCFSEYETYGNYMYFIALFITLLIIIIAKIIVFLFIITIL